MDGFHATSLVAPIMALLQSLEENFALAVTMFILGFIATITIVTFVVVMHRSVHRSEAQRESRRREQRR